jgi:hypothetical protein
LWLSSWYALYRLLSGYKLFWLLSPAYFSALVFVEYDLAGRIGQ